jgi:uridine kinase
MGCEHLAPAPRDAAARIRHEAEGLPAGGDATPEPLSDRYSRVPLACLGDGISADLLADLLCRSAKTEEDGAERLREALEAARTLAAEGLIPFPADELAARIAAWEAEGYPAVRHSESFRATYRPAYRVIANEYVRLLPLLARIGKALAGGRVILALEGGSASGKSTLGALLGELYGATVLHADDFFLPPGMRTPERLAEVGGNLDRERLLAEVLLPLSRGERLQYRRFDCRTQRLLPAVTVTPTALTVVEGAYTMHPLLSPYYTLSAFLDIDPAYQRERILVRNPGAWAERFFHEWIPMERRYFEGMRVRERCDLIIPIPMPAAR